MASKPWTINEEAGLGPNWVPVDAPPIIPGRVAPPPFASVNPVSSRYLQGSLPSSFQHDTDFTDTETQTPNAPKYSLMPLNLAQNPVTNAAVQSTATKIAQQVVANTPPAASAGTDIDLISGVNQQQFGSFDNFRQTALSVINGAANTINSISTAITTSQPNELLVAVSGGVANSGADVGQSPGVGWTSLFGDAFWIVQPSAGSVTVTQALPQSSYVATQIVAAFKTNGNTPVFTSRGNGSASGVQTATFTPTAGNSILVISGNDGPSGSAIPPNPVTVSDTQGNIYSPIGNPFATQVTGGSTHSGGQHMLYAQNISGTSMTVTVNLTSPADWAIYEISNVGSPSLSYTFQSSDANKLFQFGSPTLITTLTLPNSPVLISGWQAIVTNTGGVGVIITSSATIVGPSSVFSGTNTITLAPGASVWIFCDGAKYYIVPVTAPLSNPTAYFGADAQPLIAGTLDDEFNAPILDITRWTEVNFTGIASARLSNSLLNFQADGTTGNIAAIIQTAPTAPWEVEAKITMASLPIASGTAFRLGGICVFDSGSHTTAKMIIFSMKSTPGAGGATPTGFFFGQDNFTNITTFSATPNTVNPPNGTIPTTIWLKLKNDGVNFIFSYSVDGVNFWQLWTYGVTTFLATASFVGLHVDGTVTSPTIFSFDYFRRTL